MKAFKIVPSIAEYVDFRTLAKELKLGARDLILTNEYIYNPTIAALNLGCHTCFQEKFGGGEPTCAARSLTALSRSAAAPLSTLPRC